MQKILIIKLGALGDFIQTAGPFEAIRRFHADAEITLLTAPVFAEFSKTSPWFDKIKIDPKPKFTQLRQWIRLRNWFLKSDFSRVYDLQTSDRSCFYYQLFRSLTLLSSSPDWSGIAAGCSHPHNNPERDTMHTIDRQKEQLLMAGILDVATGDFSWVDEDIAKFELSKTFALIVPGGSPHRTAKRWPSRNYLKLIDYLVTRDIQPILLGGKEEQKWLSYIAAIKPNCISLAGKTTHTDLFALGRKACFSIGNDTGPMHALAASGCKTIVLYSSDSNPALCSQRGSDVTIIQEDNINDIEPNQITRALDLHKTNNQT
jgi:ADP-heptose:LPS heptosyltransferase